ncbi:Bacterial protein of uncharacterised function (DUF881) [Mycolicibacterium phlei]|uniref:Division initiation protein n=1 Tax=Mycolicibacterium phlei DSM 43239 = CCUG 21000 TaxID=1226750 RepID=A0A5N5USK3_MYCPH|nr:DUF881 domain-containing protein [Mycolicibacterium phlei]VEG09280.1 Bacterial protein of uncharacterised function (DUF881) [Mycobacteroides chelonae]AMO61165.1 hypothetical protein MPHLCCUG_02352 [Mycolicibacterium phlei]EID08869.1 hypothetical protein MPHLEI_26822 [Mycolicibacterium phlei RIVM601174]KAB7752586.1 hypothetical protein MPHL21000_21730 [Mycolicibacterium phlei DSM 43239 = CCUG 21000]KXW60938.1 hypothetical protein MPHL43239_23505 [Mycolicibacterium phlei DSM 43239 = CCUG 2100
MSDHKAGQHEAGQHGSGQHGRHELPPDQPSSVRRGRSQIVFGALTVLLCLALGVAIVTQVRENDSGDALETARPAELLVLLDSLQQREAALNTEVADLQRTLTELQASGSSDQAAIENAQARLAALSILIGTVAATGPGVTLTITDEAPGVAAEVLLDVVNELRNAGAEAMEIRGGTGEQQVAVRVGLDTWVVGGPGALRVDGVTLRPPYSVLAIGDPPTLAAAMTIPGGAMDAVERVGGTMTVEQSDRIDVTALRQPKQRQYAQPVK